jgi:hypothetical protein
MKGVDWLLTELAPHFAEEIRARMPEFTGGESK